jgi:hypothetical protein
VPDQGELRERLVELARAFLDHLLSAETMAVYRVVVGEGERFPELARLFYEAGPRTGIARTAEFLQDLMDRGLLRKGDPVLAAHQFKDLSLSGVFNLRLWGIIEDLTPEERAGRAETAVDTFLRAYAP